MFGQHSARAFQDNIPDRADGHLVEGGARAANSGGSDMTRVIAPADLQRTPAPSGSGHRLKAVRITGGFLDGVELELADGLNCLIGHRGTGKTTAIEFVRFALEEFRGDGDGALRRRVDGLVQTNLAGGRISVIAETKDGIEYRICRTAHEPPAVFTADGEPTNIMPGSTGVFRADVFSQDEVETIADDPLSQLALLDGFIAEPVAEIEAQIRNTIGELQSNGITVLELRGALAGTSDALNELPAIEEKLKKLAAAGGGSSPAINQAHAQKALRDREAQAIAATLELLRQEHRSLSALAGRIARQATPFEPDMLSSPNGETLRGINAAVRECAAKVDAAVVEACTAVELAGRSISTAYDALRGEHQKQEAEFRQLIEKHKIAEAQSAERAQLERKRNELLAHRKAKQDLEARLAAAQQERQALLARLSELRDGRFKLRVQQAHRITQQLGPAIRVRIEQFGNRDAYRQLIEDALEGARVNRKAVAQKIVDAVSPAELSAIVAARNRDSLIDQAGLNTNQADWVFTALAKDQVLFDLETVELIDRPWIELLDGEQYKDSLSLSTGQKCTAILPILMLDSANPLLIDQPEDNLDNSFIYETIVRSIRDVKARRQLIFVTHNPNIPVLGDAERVFVLRSDGAKAAVSHVGTVDECKDEIVTLLEGGEDAFRERQRRYNY
ncbi:MAG: AAA family ATPase [Phycisphaerae bacterium]|nr:AAA family ATPase [Planctomycetia bacterium]MCL4720267.1 AAA family ATPase [Phycisphaerae bacterium]